MAQGPEQILLQENLACIHACASKCGDTCQRATTELITGLQPSHTELEFELHNNLQPLTAHNLDNLRNLEEEGAGQYGEAEELRYGQLDAVCITEVSLHELAITVYRVAKKRVRR